MRNPWHVPVLGDRSEGAAVRGPAALWRMALAAAAMAFALVPVVGSARDLQVTLEWEALGPAPAGAEALFELRNADGGLLRRERRAIDAGALSLQTALTQVPGTASALRAGVLSGARVIAATQARHIPEARTLSPEPLRAEPDLALGFSQPLRCPEADLAFAMTEDGALRLQHPGGISILPPLPQAPAGWYGLGDSTLWVHGNRMQITLDGVELGECVPVLGPPLLPFAADGRAGDWSVVITSETITLWADPASGKVTVPRPEIVAVDGALEVHADDFSLVLRDALCHDLQSGMPSPVQVVLMSGIQDARHGCGGDPGELLRGPEWKVTRLFGAPVDAALDGYPELTVRFDEGTVSGRAACNLFLGDLSVDRSGLSFGQMATTRVACPLALQALERRFLDALDAVTRFDIGPTGTAVFYAGQMPVIAARR